MRLKLSLDNRKVVFLATVPRNGRGHKDRQLRLTPPAPNIYITQICPTQIRRTPEDTHRKITKFIKIINLTASYNIMQIFVDCCAI